MHFAYFQPPLLYVLSLSLHLSYGSPVTLMGFKSRHSHSHRGSEALPAVTQTYTHAHIYRTRTKITCWDRYKLKHLTLRARQIEMDISTHRHLITLHLKKAHPVFTLDVKWRPNTAPKRFIKQTSNI